MIKELDGRECLALRPLWEQVFSEDSREFTDYYFEKKAERNRAFVRYPDMDEAEEPSVMEFEREAPAAMLHLSPYTMEMRIGDTFSSLEINYIIGVATEEKYRHRGYMKELLKASMEHMYEKRQPFTFLMPASPKIYEPFQFVYIYNKKKYKVKVLDRRVISVLQRHEIPQLLDYANSHLKEEYDVFMRRDEAYYDTLIKELDVQNGAVYLLREQERKITGYFLYTQEGQEPDIQEALFDDDDFCKKSGFLTEAEEEPMIMARIINVRSMLSLLRRKAPDACGKADVGDDVRLTIRINDPMLEGNNGIWECSVGYGESNVQKCQDAGAEVFCSTSVDRMTSWIFGYRPPEDCFELPQGEQREIELCKLNEVRLFSRVFINEIV